MKPRSCLLLVCVISVSLLTTCWADEIDWDRARVLRQKQKRGVVLTANEAEYLSRAIKQRSAGTGERTGDRSTDGDGSRERATVPPVRVSEEDSPVKTLTVTAADGVRTEVAYRVPRSADRPLPTFVFFHGGLGKRTPRMLQEDARSNPTHTRFLVAGYVAVSATFRTYGREPLSRGPILDAIAIVRAVKELPEVDADRVIVFGGSGGGSIVLDLASSREAAPFAVVAGEPASILYAGMMHDVSVREDCMKRPLHYYTDIQRQQTEQKIDAIRCPILIHHGDTHPLKKMNNEILFPAITAAGKDLRVIIYPGEQHGFYWGNHTQTSTVDRVVASTLQFVESLSKTQAN
ncbi:dipeptidyl aminopeptidase/acylaminoacyl peptidase [Rhodopirellula rubra]|uniref:Dipeptidyl aminopeptidase/acylaminoacyl peptidase n=1 Tax=Aporhodopirellula rubra TaxID=980271 RepID=A0A7W5E2S4_9BACT|nr:prolyl oligopeptidase family serine peptidase [Aporhodopirellula rubra]MBB3209070.1 dipeptidyl aminopeptidase/acylaminoacyl peptidase [Aporhodopirellula rubra]